jgi:hypothetical protein
MPLSASDQKKLAARDYEDYLQVSLGLHPLPILIASFQCSMPVFEGLFENLTYNRLVLDMLYDLCTWLTLAKLRLHTDTSLGLLSSITRSLGFSIRKFASGVCSKYKTFESTGTCQEERQNGRWAEGAQVQYVNVQAALPWRLCRLHHLIGHIGRLDNTNRESKWCLS